MHATGKMAADVVKLCVLVYVLLLSCVSVHSFRPGSKATTLHFPKQETDDGIRRIRRSISQEDTASSARSRVARQADNSGIDPASDSDTSNIIVTKVDLMDSHPELIVHWAGKNSDVIICMTRDITQSSSSTSFTYFSHDYGASFQNRSIDMSTSYVGTPKPIYDRFYSSKADIQRYIFTDVINSIVTTTEDMGVTFYSYSIPFKPTAIYTHAANRDIVLGMDENDNLKRLYISINFGGTWTLVDQDVKSFSWGVEPWDKVDTIYVERLEVDGTSTVRRSDDFFRENIELVVTSIKDFEVRDDYLFATRTRPSLAGQYQLLVSHDRGAFMTAEFPLNLPAEDFYIADASEEQVFACVYHNDKKTNLYISEAKGAVFTLSLEDVFYYSPNGPGKDSWLNRYADDPFADIHKVDGLRGIYIATQLNDSGSTGSLTEDNMVSMMTYDKGGEWFRVPGPEYNVSGAPYNCHAPDCSLHLSQKFSQLYPGSRTIPILSKSSAPGLIMATGKVGATLNDEDNNGFNIYVSASAGASWYEVLIGTHFFTFGDHGGVLTAVDQRGGTNSIKYSINEGETWHTEVFTTSKIYVYGLMTEPGEETATFTVFGSEMASHSWLIVQINLRGVFSTTCGDDDYKQWWPGEEFPEHQCLLGRKTIYDRRRVHSDCYNGRDYDRPISSVNCSCVRDDFECDYGFMERDDWSEICVKDPDDSTDPTAQPDPCPEDTFYRRSKGYRKVEGDTCKGGQETYYEADQVSCPVARNPEFILYAERTEIHRYFLADGTDERLPIENLELATAVDYDVGHNCYYYAEVTYDEIHRFCPDEEDQYQDRVLVSTDLDMVEGLAFDWLAHNLYWLDSNTDTIEVARYDGRFRRKLSLNVTLDQPRALALDPKRGKMYWSDWGNNPYIAVAHMDGNNVQKIVTTGIYWPNGLAIDDQSAHIFWTDAHYDRIETAYLDGSYREVLLDEDIPHPFAIAVYKNSIYWDDWSDLNIQSANKVTGQNKQVVVSNLDSAMDMKIFHNASQQGVNPCSTNNGGCTHLCIVTPNVSNPDVVTRVCLCPDNMGKTILPDGREQCTCPSGEKLDPKTGECITSGSTCASTQFMCLTDERCIPLSWQCDHEADCSDGSDEANCPYYTCSTDEFQCQSVFRCIPLSWQCDHYDDCGDNSDEQHCVFPTCSTNQFTCNNSRCIPEAYVCDMDNDCWDGSDEEGCVTTPVPTPPPSCSSAYFQCPGGRCIPESWVCDGEDDCGDNADERNCNQTCPSYQFTCDNGHCIPSYWECDNYDDCGDNSDEQNCNTTTITLWTTGNPFTCTTNEFRCFLSGSCIPDWWKCDGYPDCTDGSDEYDCSDYTTYAPGSCDSGSFTCDNGNCIPWYWECDNYDDCGDNSDEQHCTSTLAPTTPASCGFLRVPCGPSSTVRCIWYWFVCDGEDDCTDGSDETNCGTDFPTTNMPPPTTVSSCNSHQFKCANGQKCIPNDQRCDGINQCSDLSDENGCTLSTTTSSAPFCGLGQFFCFYSSSCIDDLQMCDGMAQCRYLEDENNCDATYVLQSLYVTEGDEPTAANVRIDTSGVNVPDFYVVLWKREYDSDANVPGHDLPNSVNVTINGINAKYGYTWTNLKSRTEYEFTGAIKVGSKVYRKAYLYYYTTPAVSTGIPVPRNVGTHLLYELDGSYSVNVTWDAISSRGSPSYEVQYHLNFSSHYISALTTPKTHTIISRLEVNTMYGFQVRASVEGEWGNFSEEAIAYIFPVDPGTIPPAGHITNPPSGLQSSDQTDHSVKLMWTAPRVSHGTNIDGYKIYAGISDDKNGYEMQSTHVANSTSSAVLVQHLCKGVLYTFQVMAYNDMGDGPLSQALQAQTGGQADTVPQRLLASANSFASVTLTWLPPKQAPAKPAYEIYRGKRERELTYVTATGDRKYVVQNLTSAITYLFAVRVKDDECDVTPWAITNATTQYDVKLRPKWLRVISTDFKTVTVQWHSPRDEPYNLPYLLEYWDVTKTAERLNKTISLTSATTVTYNVTGLIPGATYDFTIRTNYTQSQPFGPVNATTDIPSIPQSFEAKTDQEGGINLYWYRPAHTFNDTIGYAVYIMRVADTWPNRDYKDIPPESWEWAKHNDDLWTIKHGIPYTQTHYEFLSTDYPPDEYVVMVSTDRYMGYYGERTDFELVNPKIVHPQPQIKKGSVPWLAGVIAAVVLVLVLISVLVYFVVRHRRLQRSFMSFANSHYDTRSGTATFAANEDDDGGDLGSDEDQPMIRGFSDDVPLVVA